jgi:hypothetical protein
MTDEQAEQAKHVEQVARAIFGRWYPRIDYDDAHEEIRADMQVIAREELNTLERTEAMYGTRETRPWWEPS